MIPLVFICSPFNKQTIIGILESKTRKDEKLYLVKWENYDDPTWEPAQNIPEFITNYYERTGKKTVPAARVKHTKVVGMNLRLPELKLVKYHIIITLGGSKFHLLAWDDQSGEMYWEDDKAFNFKDSAENEMYSCNTRKVSLILKN